MGRKIVITGASTFSGAPRLNTIDQIESVGSIFLFDWTHPAQTDIDGTTIPAFGAVMPNMLASFGDAIVGATVAPTVLKGGNWDGTKGLLERTTKGGLHGVVSPTLADNGIFWWIAANEAVNDYVRTNPTNAFYLSVWGRTTKAPTDVTSSTKGVRAIISKLNSPATNALIVLSNNNPASASGGLGRRAGTDDVGGEFYNQADDTWSGGPAPADGDMSVILGSVPTLSAWNSTNAMRRAQGGFIFYRCYLEDMTVSGRTYAEIDAIDLALFTAEVLTADGRYYGDAYTDPSTIT